MRTTKRQAYMTCGGFTLIEVLIAMVVLSVGLLGLAAMTITTMRGIAYSEDMTTAINLAQEEMEAIKQAGYHNALPIVDYTPVPDFEDFEKKVSIEPGPPGTKKVVVTVSWTQIGGKSSQVDLQTILSP